MTFVSLVCMEPPLNCNSGGIWNLESDCTEGSEVFDIQSFFPLLLDDWLEHLSPSAGGVYFLLLSVSDFPLLSSARFQCKSCDHTPQTCCWSFLTEISCWTWYSKGTLDAIWTSKMNPSASLAAATVLSTHAAFFEVSISGCPAAVLVPRIPLLLSFAVEVVKVPWSNSNQPWT